MPDWSKPFWIQSDWVLEEARERELDGEGKVAFDEDPGPCRWLPFPQKRERDNEQP